MRAVSRIIVPVCRCGNVTYSRDGVCGSCRKPELAALGTPSRKPPDREKAEAADALAVIEALENEKDHWHHRHALMERDRDLKDAEIASLRARIAALEEAVRRVSEGAAQWANAQSGLERRYPSTHVDGAGRTPSGFVKEIADALDKALTGEESK
jgi:hypothetical protein